MKKSTPYIIAAFALASLSLFSSCKHFRCVHGSGNIVTENRKANEFTRLDVSGSYKVFLKQDSSLTISIKGDDNLLKYVSTSVEGDQLTIKSRKNFCSDGDIVINIGIRNLKEIGASGAVELSSAGKINTGDLKFDLSGATKINLDVNAANLVSETSGMSELNLTGQAASHRVETSGVAKIHAFDFVVGDYEINTSGVSDCKINVLKTLNVHSSGASEIQYKGSPATVNNDKSGASSIKKVD
ncbi:MAG TPA: head GIN domain-containing protein [Mucilaginibacter sp.]